MAANRPSVSHGATAAVCFASGMAVMYFVLAHELQTRSEVNATLSTELAKAKSNLFDTQMTLGELRERQRMKEQQERLQAALAQAEIGRAPKRPEDAPELLDFDGHSWRWKASDIPNSDFAHRSFYTTDDPKMQLVFCSGGLSGTRSTCMIEVETSPGTFTKHGLEKRVHKDGSFDTRQWRNGELHGEWLSYWAVGAIRSKRSFTFGKEYGEGRYFDDQGNLERIGSVALPRPDPNEK
jgi:hypothetical protein